MDNDNTSVQSPPVSAHDEAFQRLQRRAEDLMGLARELSSSIRLPELVQSFTQRAANMLGASSAALALARGQVLETVHLYNVHVGDDKTIVRRLNLSLSATVEHGASGISFHNAEEALGRSLADALAWNNLTLAPLNSAEGELIGVLCLANCGDLNDNDRNLLQALIGHASVALENSRLFARIAQSNSQWVEIFDSISDFIVVHDDENRVMRVNRSMADFIGVRPSELIGVGMRAVMALAQETGPYPCPFCRRDGRADEFIHPVLERTYLVSTSTIRGALDEGMQTIHVLKDITDRREAERRYRELFDNIQEGLFFSSPEGRFIEVNEALVRMLGYSSREELLQVDIPNDLYFAPEARDAFKRAIENAGRLHNYEEALRRKDGSVIHTLQNAFAVRDAHGRILQFRGLILDITELKTFQAELQRQRDFTAKILNHTQSLIVVADTAGLITYANRRCHQAMGFDKGELVGRPLVSLIAPKRQAALDQTFAQILAGKQVDNLELPILVKGQEPGQFSVNLSPMRDEQGQVNAIVAVMTDITDAALLQAKLMHTEKMAAVGQLVSGVAHEVNNPLTAILGFADLLSEDDELPGHARDDLQIIIAEAQRTKQIVQNLLSFARQMPAKREKVNVNDIVSRTLKLRAYDFANHGVQVTERLGEPMPEITGDPHQLQQVFLNIVNNAYDAVRETPRKGKISIETVALNDGVEVRFTDNGPGIKSPERIFDPFYTTKEVGKGTGLGLSICYGIVREHGGEIACRNRADAPGAVFTVALPLAAPEKAMQAKGAQ